MSKTCGVQIKFIRNEPKLTAFMATPGIAIMQLHSPECAYCIEEAPHFVRASFEYCSVGKFARVDVSDLQDSTLEDLKVEGIPLILVFKDGTEAGRKEGFADFEEISEFLEKHV